MSVTALHLYEQLTEATDDKTRARVIAEAFGQLEDRYPNLKEIATQSHLRETELRLQKEIAGVEANLRKEIAEVEANLRKEIEHVRLEIKEVEARLLTEIHRVDLKVAETKAELIRWVVGVGILQTTLIAGMLMRMAHFI
jgi:hypothetical protein